VNTNTAVLAQKALAKNDWPVCEIDGLTLIKSPLLAGLAGDGLVHAFTTRLGGDSAPPLNWFNLGRHWPTEESRQNAMANRQRLCRVLGLNEQKLTVPGQQHTTNIYIVEAQSACHTQRLPELDGAVTDTAELPLLLHFADCVPIMLFDRRRRLLAVLHAGWKGTTGGIAKKCIRLLAERWQSDPADVAAAIGPAIGPCCYPTGEDVAVKLSHSVKDGNGLDGLIVQRDGKPHPDLKAFNALQLLQSGVEQIDVSSWCTACHPQLFYSHRQSKGQTGRQGAIACIKPAG
jgi:YfiH family protein